MSSERKFASLQLVIGTDNTKRFVAVADDGSGWISSVEWVPEAEGSVLNRAQAENWFQIRPLPQKDE